MKFWQQNEMKRITAGLYSPDQINAMEMSINQCIFFLSINSKSHYLNPFEAVESYMLKKKQLGYNAKPP